MSNYYENQHTVLSFRCKQGHEWSTEAGNVSNGAWCHECGGSKPLTIEQMHKMAAEKGGKCLSKKYTNVETHLRWQCSKGHIFEMKPNNVRIGHWCRECGIEKSGLSRRLSIEEFQEIAESRGGKCLSSEYFGQSVKLMWECSQGHPWPATPKNIKKGRWCPECAKKRSRKC